jgi:uncharacterized protein YndB with AHSA1/START domain
VSDGVFTTSVRIAAVPEVVFPYLTDAGLMVRWMGDWAELQATPGGTFAVDISGVPVRGEFVEVEPPHRLVFTWGAPGNAAVPPGSTTVEITLRPDGEATVVELVHRDLPPEELARHGEGWDWFLPRLAGAAAGGDAVYAGIVARLSTEAGVAVGRMFRSEGLNHQGRYFALMARRELVVKLPAARVTELTEAGTGRPFEPSAGRALREWLAIPATESAGWPGLADEALAFARALGPK